ncbi:MAG: hypothetical protein GXO61_01005 [Epsilonproteobacteria bacterium]|nr:hypothetical protein [Campylobacterota bacterium]
MFVIIKLKKMKLLVTATKIEALPFIRAYKLERFNSKPFSIYGKEEIFLLITGIGKIKAATALSHAVTTLKPKKLVNIGYAAGEGRGKLYEIKKVIDFDTQKVFHLRAKTSFLPAVCTTFSKPVKKPISTLADMEASALVEVANLYKKPIQIFKIVSDRFEPQSFIRSELLIEKQLASLLKEL